jgi:hypothetical protein
VFYFVVFELFDDGMDILANGLVYHQKRVSDIHTILSTIPILMPYVFQKEIHHLALHLQSVLQAQDQGQNCIKEVALNLGRSYLFLEDGDYLQLEGGDDVGAVSLGNLLDDLGDFSMVVEYTENDADEGEKLFVILNSIE